MDDRKFFPKNGGELNRIPGLVFGLAACLLTFPQTLLAADWPQWQGPHGNNNTSQELGLNASEYLQLELKFKSKLGAGYSFLVQAGDLLVTLATQEDGDYVLALDRTTGALRWRFRMEDPFLGRDGSDDGPLSTPAIGENKVYALSGRGRLVALDQASGSLVWSKNIPETFGGKLSTYGYSTVPLPHQGKVLLAVGGENSQTAVAFDGATGKVIWRAGIETEVRYQNPVLTTLLGKKMYLVPTQSHLLGLDPDSGELMWQTEMEAENDHRQILPIDSSRFLISTTSDCRLFHIEHQDSGYQVRQTWKSTNLRMYGIPVVHEGHLYGFRGSFLSCVSLENGEPVWKSRAPGGYNLIMVDQTLVFWNREGDLYTVAASSKEYQPKGRIELGGATRNFSTPIAAQGLLYARDSKHVYAVKVNASQSVTLPVESQPEPIGMMADLTAQLANSEKDAVIRQFLEKHPQSPVVDVNGWLHFYYQGDAKDMALTGDMTGGFQALPMFQVPGTDFWYRSFQIEPGNRWEYRYHEFERSFPDPANPLKAGPDDRPVSVFESPDWQGFASTPNLDEKAKGSLTKINVPLMEEGESTEVTVYLPAGLDKTDIPYLIVPKGKLALEEGNFVQVLDQRSLGTGKAIGMVFLDLPRAYDFPMKIPDLKSFLNKNLLPSLHETFPALSQKTSNRGLLVHEWSTVAGLTLLLSDEMDFGIYLVQSPCFEANFVANELLPKIDKIEKKRVVLGWGRYDWISSYYPIHVAKDSRQLVDLLNQHGHQAVGKELPGGHGWVVWRSHLNALLDLAFPN